MFFKQFYLQGLGHASYLVGSEDTGEALLFDPQLDVSGYFVEARMQGLRVRHALDSHGHNDYLSGLTEVGERGEVELLASAAADVGFAHRPVRDGERFDLGEVGFEVLHTPGHTPEHISLLVYDGQASADEPALLLSGGALLVGDLARPDLLGGPDEAEASAKEFCSTIQTKILELADHVEVFPTHVAGSLCGGNIGSRLSTTVGFERRTNEILARVSSKGEFVEQCLRLDNLPAVPPYWKRMRRQNLAGVAPLGVLREPPALKPEAVKRLVQDGAVVLDTRPAEAFRWRAHPGRSQRRARGGVPDVGGHGARRGRGHRPGARFPCRSVAGHLGPAPHRLRPAGRLAGRRDDGVADRRARHRRPSPDHRARAQASAGRRPPRPSRCPPAR